MKEESKVLLCDEFISILEDGNGTFGIVINLSDFFDTCADSIMIDVQDFIWILPFYKKYDWDGIYAAVSFIVKQLPMKNQMNQKFNDAYKEIELLNPMINTEVLRDYK